MLGYLDAARDTAKGRLQNLVGTVMDRIGHHEQSQSLTVADDEQTVKQFFRDPRNLSAVLGDIADVEMTEPERYRWEFRQGPAHGVGWDSILVEDNGRLRFVDARQEVGDQNEIVIDFSEAPRSMGTEVTLRVKSPAPALLSGALAYKVLYRARALKSAQQHGQRYIAQFFDYVAQGDLDPSVLITHDMPLEDGVRAYDMFKNKKDGCIRVALRP